MNVIEHEPRVSPVLRWLAGLLLASLPVAAILLSYSAWHSRLPDPLPTHWSLSGSVDGVTALTAFVTVTLAIAGAGVLVALIGAAGAPLSRRVRRVLVSSGGTVSAFGAGLWFIVALVALDVADAREAPAPTWHIPALLVIMGAGFALTWLACPPPAAHPPARERPASGLPRLDLPPGQRAAWSEVAYPGAAIVLLGSALVAAAAVLVVATPMSPWVASPLVLAAAVTVLGSVTRLTADRRGVRVGFGPWGWPRVTVALSEIESAKVTEVRPTEWGGWGYRVRPHGRAVVLRRGPGVELALSGQRRFVASTRDPETVAGLVNSLVEGERGRVATG